MNLTKPIQYSFLGLQGMTSKVHIVPKNREHQKSALFEWLWALFERKSGKKVPCWHNFPKKITLRACGKCHVWPVLARFLPSFSILRIAGVPYHWWYERSNEVSSHILFRRRNSWNRKNRDKWKKQHGSQLRHTACSMVEKLH